MQFWKWKMPKKLRILVILPRGEAIRNVLYSGALDLLRDEAEVVVLSVRPCDEVWNLLKERSDDLEELRSEKEPYLLGFVREILHSAHECILQSEAAKHHVERRLAEARGLKKRIKLAVKVGIGRWAARARVVRALEWVEELWAENTHAARMTDKLLRRWRPDIVFNASHVHGVQARAILARARKFGVPLQTFVFSWDNLTTKGRMIPRYDSYLVWSSQMAEELLQIYPDTNANEVIITGSPQFDMHHRVERRIGRAEFCKGLGLNPELPIILYTTGMPNHIPYEEEVVEVLLSDSQLPGDLNSWYASMLKTGRDGLTLFFKSTQMCAVRPWPGSVNT
jgi:glycerol-3-phosphate cytidylyltransferase-like family protein